MFKNARLGIVENVDYKNWQDRKLMLTNNVDKSANIYLNAP